MQQNKSLKAHIYMVPGSCIFHICFDNWRGLQLNFVGNLAQLIKHKHLRLSGINSTMESIDTKMV